MLWDVETSNKLSLTDDLEEAKEYCKILIPELTEEEVQQMAEEIISIK